MKFHYFDPYKEDEDRKAHERGLERKALSGMVKIKFTPTISARLHRHKPKPVTLAPAPFKDRQ